MAWTSTSSTELDLPNGAKIYEGTFDAICGNFAHLGGTSGAQWTDWTPTVTEGGAVAVTVTHAKYVKIGYAAMIDIELEVTGSGTSGNEIIIGGIPAAIAPSTWSSYHVVGSFDVEDVGTMIYAGSAVVTSATQLKLHCNQAGVLGVNPAISLASSDTISISAAWPTT